jgi:acetolactate decarboxylase
MASLSCNVPASVLAAVERRAREGGVAASSVVSEALARYLATPLHTLFQISTSGSLVEGVYAQAVTCEKVLEHGNFGLGTFADLDGEMVVLDGKVYRVRGDGTVSLATPDAGIPFAVVTAFAPSSEMQIEKIGSLAELVQRCDGHRRSDNLFYALRLDGRFTGVLTRAVSPPSAGTGLLDASKSQSEFRFKDAVGTVVGIYSPSFSGAFSIPGYHFHFLSDDRTQGGHLLDVSSDLLRLQMEELTDFHLALPENATFLQADLSHDATAGLKQAEGNQ